MAGMETIFSLFMKGDALSQMSRFTALFLILCISATMLAGCGSAQSGGGNSQISYKEVKSMVIDILKSDDGKKALEEIQGTSGGVSALGGSQMNMLSPQDQDQIKLAVKDVLTSPDYEQVIEKIMTDTRFAGEFAKAVNEQNKQIHKDLMKDPAYQEALADALKGPEFDKMIMNVMNSSQYRKHTITIMNEALNSPLIKMQIMELLKKVVQEELNPKEQKKEKESKGEGQKEQGEQGGSEDSSSSGDGGD
jgi:spore germination protein D